MPLTFVNYQGLAAGEIITLAASRFTPFGLSVSLPLPQLDRSIDALFNYPSSCYVHTRTNARAHIERKSVIRHQLLFTLARLSYCINSLFQLDSLNKGLLRSINEATTLIIIFKSYHSYIMIKKQFTGIKIWALVSKGIHNIERTLTIMKQLSISNEDTIVWSCASRNGEHLPLLYYPVIRLYLSSF